LRALHNISETEARENVVKPKRSKITNRNSSTSESNPAIGKISTRPKSKTYITVSHDESDIVPCTEKFLSMEGNHVYLRIDATRTYLLLNHLKKDSVTVAVGDRVNAGEVLGHVGNSGSTSERHLHIHQMWE
jgi:murein DD-endopeptidase MepM/ murein hydrolase activator NlpD